MSRDVANPSVRSANRKRHTKHHSTEAPNFFTNNTNRKKLHQLLIEMTVSAKYFCCQTLRHCEQTAQHCRAKIDHTNTRHRAHREHA